MESAGFNKIVLSSAVVNFPSLSTGVETVVSNSPSSLILRFTVSAPFAVPDRWSSPSCGVMSTGGLRSRDIVTRAKDDPTSAWEISTFALSGSLSVSTISKVGTCPTATVTPIRSALLLLTKTSNAGGPNCDQQGKAAVIFVDPVTTSPTIYGFRQSSLCGVGIGC